MASLTTTSLLGSDEASAHSNMAIVLSLSEDDIKSMERAGNSLRFVTGGPTPVFRFGGRSIDLTMSPEKFTQELYHATSVDEFRLVGRVSHRARLVKRPMSAKHEEQDEAVLALTSSMAAYKKEKEASQTHLANGFLPIPKNRREAAQQQRRGGMVAASKHLHSASPSAAATRVTTQAPASARPDVSALRTRAMRTALVHFLAMGDATTADVVSSTHIPESEAKSLLQTMAQPVDRQWRLADKSFKELDVWRFRYATSKDRKLSIDNAVRAYDRMRLSRDDKLWQLLLPQTERGQGTVLSRLHINNNVNNSNNTPHALTPRVQSPLPQVDSLQSSAANTPRLGPSGTPKIGATKKAGGDVMKRLLSKDPKKARAVEEAKEKKRKERQSQEDSADTRPAKRQAVGGTTRKNANVKSEELVHSSDEGEVDVPTKHDSTARPNSHNRSLSNNTHNQKPSHPNSASKVAHASKQANEQKSTPPPLQQPQPKSRPIISPPKPVTKPTVPSPLGAARPRVTSDVSDRSGIGNHKRTRTIQGPRSSDVPEVRKRHDTLTSMESSEDVRNQLKEDESKRKATGTLKDKPANAATKINQQDSRVSSASTSVNTQSSDERFDGGTSDSSASILGTITFAQGLDLAQKFKSLYYPQYTKLYDSIAHKRDRGEMVDDTDFDKLYEMQDRLEQMKREIEAASGRKRDGHSS